MPGDESESSFECLNDVSTEQDVLGFRPYVEAIAEFLTAKGTLAPITLSIEGQWGCGKSSFMKQLKEEIERGNICDISIRKFIKYLFLNKKKEDLPELKPLISKLETLFSSIEEKFSQKNGNELNNQDENFDPYSFGNKIRAILIYIPSKIKRRKYFTVWFNCWRYEKEDELWAAFALIFMEQLSEQLSWWRRPWAQFKLRYLRLEWKGKSSFCLKILSFLAFLFALYSIPNIISLNESAIIITQIIGFILSILYIWKDIRDIIGNPFNFSKLVSNPNYTEHISFIEHFHSDFDRILESYVGNSRVYVFVDDLDRCEVPKAAELMQALNLMISDKANVYFSIGIDRKVISAGLAAKNGKILRHLGVNGLKYGYDYIEKFIQLPFKVPSPKTGDFKKFMNPLPEKRNSWLYDDPLSKMFKKFFSKFKVNHLSSQFDKNSIPSENPQSGKPGEDVPINATNDEPEKEENITNDIDCDEKLVELDHILEMVAPALDRNPRRMKQFINQFRFQRTIGKRTGLFSYNKGTAPENMWNCKKLAKFVAISINWNAIIAALNSNRMLLTHLQEYVLLQPKNEDKNLEEWVQDKRLIELLKYGCVEESNPSQNAAEYTLSGLDLSKLLQVSPVVVYPEETPRVFKDHEIPKTSISPSTDMEFLLISAGSFSMGSPSDQDNRYNDEEPIHKVTIKNPFYLGKYPVTQKHWTIVMGNNPSSFKGDNLPVESISWNDVQEFIAKLNKMEGTVKYRLPSEAEWEYACRAGTTTRYFFGDDESKLGYYAWYSNNSEAETHPVGQKKPNPWGLYDMHGNVWEWVQDRWHDNYKGAPSDSNAWEKGSNFDRVSRGGSWHSDALRCRSAYRLKYFSDVHYRIGFRLLKEL